MVHGEIGVNDIAAQIISTERLDLIPLRVDHSEEMAAVLSDPALYRFIGGSPDSAADLCSRYRRLTAGSPDPGVSWLNWVIRLCDESCLTGMVQATIGPGEHGRIAEIAWMVGTPWQRRGIGAEATRGLVDWLSRQPNVQAVIAHIHPEHLASAAVATAAGLTATSCQHEGEIRWHRSVGPARLNS
ncbi:GNAT family N-acetyltransferase [Nocardia sp. NPDC020380]|uniref:GNAT family N-acetyltransferase n=1 Tax=Nocardia sp. NPDC020380 TaxID=3364309 RepID=UPI00378BA663